MKKIIGLLLALVSIQANALTDRKVDAGYVQFKQVIGVTPTPATGYNYLFTKADNKLYVSPSTGASFLEQVHSGAESLSSSLFTGTLPVSKGGTGVATVTPSSILYGNTTNPLGMLAIGSSSQVLKGGVIPSFGAVALGSDVSGQLPIANGGTGQATQTAAFNALSPNTTKGDITVHNGTNNVRLPVGTNGFFLTADSAQTEGIKWVSSSAAAGGTAPNIYYRYQSEAGYGSTNNKIPYYNTLVEATDAGSCVTVSNSSTNGISFTINSGCDGLYCIMMTFANTTTGRYGFSFNSSQLTTAIHSITAANRLTSNNVGTNGEAHTLMACKYAVANDVFRPHTDGGAVDNDVGYGINFWRSF